MAKEVKAVKDIGWSKLELTTKKGFLGAIQSYKSSKGGQVAVAFNLHDAFIIEDEHGLFEVEDLHKGLIKDSSIDIEATGQIEGAIVLAWEEDGVFEVNADKLEELGLNDFEVKRSLEERLTLLAALDQLSDMQM